MRNRKDVFLPAPTVHPLLGTQKIKPLEETMVIKSGAGACRERIKKPNQNKQIE